MDQSNAASRRLSGSKEGTAVDRTQSAVTNGLRKKLKEMMMEFQVLRQRMMTEYKDTVGRKYYTVTGEYLNEDVIEKIISYRSGGEEFLVEAMQEHGRGKVLETVAEIQDRHDAAKETEKSLLELYQVFLEMAVMVEAQGEQMDDIEHHVMGAAQYTSDGSKNLATAKKYQKGSKRWNNKFHINMTVEGMAKVLWLREEICGGWKHHKAILPQEMGIPLSSFFSLDLCFLTECILTVQLCGRSSGGGWRCP